MAGEGRTKATPSQTVLSAHGSRGSSRSEVEDRHIKEVTDTFAFVQVVDVVMVSRGRREAEQRGKHF